MKKFLLLLAMIPILLLAENLTLNDLWDLSLQNNKQLKQLKTQAYSANSQLKIKQASFFPKLTSKGSYAYVSEVPSINLGMLSKEMSTHSKYDFLVSLQQPVFTGFRLTNEKLISQSDVELINLQQLQLKQQIFYQIAVLYHKICSLNIQNELLTQSEKRLILQKNKIISLYSEKLAVPFDTLEISNRILEINANQIDINGQINSNQFQLCRLIGLETIDQLSLKVPEKEIFSSFDTIYSKALNNRPEIKIANQERKKIKQQKKVAQSLYYPQFYAQAEYHYANPGTNIVSEWQSYYTAGISFSLNLWDWSENKEKNNLVQQQLFYNEIKKSDIQLATQQDIKSLLEQINTCENQILLANKLIDQENSRLNLITLKYNQSQATTTDILDSEAKLTEANLKKEIYHLNKNILILNLETICGMIGE